MIEANIDDRDDGAMTEFLLKAHFGNKDAARPLLPTLSLAATADYRQDGSGIAGDRS
jgi:hypothetical protein